MLSPSLSSLPPPIKHSRMKRSHNALNSLCSTFSAWHRPGALFLQQQHEFRTTPEKLLSPQATSLAPLTSRGPDLLCPHSTWIFQAQILAGTFVILCFYSHSAVRASDLSSPVHLCLSITFFFFFKPTYQRGQAYLFPKWIVKSWQ